MSDELFTASNRRLELHGAVHRLRLAALAEPATPGYRGHAEAPLYAVRFAGPPGRVSADDERLRIQFAHRWSWPWLGTRQTDLGLHPGFRWHMVVRGGLARAELDLSRLEVEALHVHGGLDRVLVRLPAPTGDLAFDVRGGASRLRLVCPPGVGLRVRIDGGVDRLQVDTLRVGAIGGRFEWQTPGYARGPHRVDVRLRGGVHDLAVDWASDPLALLDPFAPTRLAAWPRLFGAPR